MERRLKAYNQENSVENYAKGKMPTMRFFQENETEIYEVDYDIDNFEMIEGARIYIERHGRPYNYLQSNEQINQNREEELEKLEEEEVARSKAKEE